MDGQHTHHQQKENILLSWHAPRNYVQISTFFRYFDQQFRPGWPEDTMISMDFSLNGLQDICRPRENHRQLLMNRLTVKVIKNLNCMFNGVVLDEKLTPAAVLWLRNRENIGLENLSA